MEQNSHLEIKNLLKKVKVNGEWNNISLFYFLSKWVKIFFNGRLKEDSTVHTLTPFMICFSIMTFSDFDTEQIAGTLLRPSCIDQNKVL